MYAPRGTGRMLHALALALLAGPSAAGEKPPAVRIMPLGDSITEGYDGQATYRYFLWHMLADGRYDVDFAGTRRGVVDGQPLYADFDQDHEGHCAWRADEVFAEIAPWLLAAEPDVVLVHLGTNDITCGEPPTSTIADLAGIVDAIRAHNPRAAILLGQIIPAFVCSAEIRALNEEIAALAAEKNTDDSPVIVVDHWTGFSVTDDTCDGLHPNERGERKIAARWYEELVELLPAPPAAPEGGGCYVRRQTGTSAAEGALAAVLVIACAVFVLLRALVTLDGTKGRGRRAIAA